MRSLILVVLGVASLLGASHAAGVATASIDFGNEWMEISLVKPGVPMEIVLNSESKRKTNTVVSVRNGEWLFSDAAMTNAIKYPLVTHRFLLQLLGQQVDSEIVKSYQKAFPFQRIEAHPERGTVVFRHSEDVAYSVEELVGMILRHAASLAERDAGQALSGVVITVPPFFNQAERRAMLLAAKIAGLNVLQLINTNTAVALHYGVFRRSEFNSSEQNIMFYDMGSSSTTASIVGFSTVDEKGSSTPVPQLQIKSVGYDRTLGGFEWDLRVQKHLEGLFTSTTKKKPQGDIKKDPRAQARLLKEANRVKTILSANTDMFSQVEGLFEEIDFKAAITRETLETLSADLFERVTAPIDDALEAAGMTMDDINQFVIVGGAPRIPKVQKKLADYLKGKEIGKNINADEAASLGGAYQAAVLSKAFKVKKFIVKDANLFPIQVHFDKQGEDEAEGADAAAATGDAAAASAEPRRVIRTLFTRNNAVPQKKALSFNKVTGDFKFNVNYGDLSFLKPIQLQALGPLNISEVDLSGVIAALESNKNNNAKGVKVHFRIDESGILKVDGAEAYFEAEVVPEDSSILDKISNFFSKNNTDNTTETATEASDKTDEKAQDETADKEKEETKSEEKPADSKTEDKSTEEKTAGEDKAEESAEKKASSTDDATASAVNGTDAVNATATNATETVKEVKPPKPKTIKVPLNIAVITKDVAEPNNETVIASIGRIKQLEARELDKRANAEAKNALETFIYSTKDKITQDNVIEVSTQQEREELDTKLTAAAAWLDDEGSAVATAEYIEKREDLNKTARPIFFRLQEKVERPEAIARMRQSINMTFDFISRVKAFNANLTEDELPWVTPKDLSELETLANETQEWLNEKIAKQKETALTEEPVLKTSLIGAKLGRLDRELMYLVRRPRPKPKPKAFNFGNSTTNGTTTGKAKRNTADTDNTTTTTNGTDSEVPIAGETLEKPEGDAAGAGEKKEEEAGQQQQQQEEQEEGEKKKDEADEEATTTKAPTTKAAKKESKTKKDTKKETKKDTKKDSKKETKKDTKKDSKKETKKETKQSDKSKKDDAGAEDSGKSEL